jgi:hypothetical protein
MQDRCTFEYAIIRVVPKVEREEFLSLSGSFFKTKKFLGIKYLVNPNKLNVFSPEIEIEVLNNYF